jgi:hypothetical protein
MSTLKINTLSNLAGSQSTPVENAINGSAKAWVNFNGTGTVAIRAAYNVSSVTDLGVGSYDVNFATPFANANYATALAGSDGSWGNKLDLDTSAYQTTTVSRVRAFRGNMLEAQIDIERFCAIYFR